MTPVPHRGRGTSWAGISVLLDGRYGLRCVYSVCISVCISVRTSVRFTVHHSTQSSRCYAEGQCMRMRGSALCCQSSVRLGGGYPSSRCSQISARVPVVSACEAGIECQKAAASAAPPIVAVRGKGLDGGPGRGACVSHQGWRGPARQAIGGGGRAWLPGGERRAGNTCLRHIGMGRRGRGSAWRRLRVVW